jgi:hypothetical protein
VIVKAFSQVEVVSVGLTQGHWLDGYTLRLLTKQNGRCPLCGDELLCAEQPPQSPEDWERWWLQITRRAIVGVGAGAGQHEHLHRVVGLCLLDEGDQITD